MKNVARNLNLDWNWNKNIDYGYFQSNSESLEKLMIIFGVGYLIGILLAVMLAGFLYGIQQKTVDQGKLSYGNLFIIVIGQCILLGLIAGILLL